MTYTATLDQPGPDTTSPRDKLRTIIGQVAEEQDRLSALVAAQSRARTDGWHLRSQLSDLTSKLERVSKDQNANLAYQYLNDEVITVDPVASAKADVDAVQKDRTKLELVERSLVDEITRVEARLRILKMNQYETMAKVIATSDQHRALIAAHHAAWTRLRSIKAALRLVASAVHGNLDTDWSHRVEPMEKRIGFPVDEAFVHEWQQAVDELSTNADVQLPTNL